MEYEITLGKDSLAATHIHAVLFIYFFIYIGFDVYIQA